MDDRLKPDYVFIGDGKGKVTRVGFPMKDITEDIKPNPYHIGEHLGDGDWEFLKPKDIDVDMSKYITPIELFYRDYSMQMEKRIEETVLKAVSEIGVNIDKERLIKILDGDRKSYEDGYRKGFEDGQTSLSFPLMREICKYYHLAFDQDHTAVDSCQYEVAIPSGCSWGECKFEKCPFLNEKEYDYDGE